MLSPYVVKPPKRPVDWSMAVLITLCVIYAGCIAGLIVSGADIIR